MIWIDGEYFEPLWYGSLSELMMSVAWQKEKLFIAIFDTCIGRLAGRAITIFNNGISKLKIGK